MRQGTGLQSSIRSADGDLAAVRHGIARVDRQVHHHLFGLPGIGLGAAELRVERGDELDVFANEPAHQLRHVVDHEIQVEDSGRQHLLAAEGQQLAREAGGAVGGFLHFFHAGAQRIAGLHLVEHQLAVAFDDGEQVVEVVGHAAGQPAHRFHLLRLAELLFQSAPLGDVLGDHLEALEVALVIAQSAAAEPHGDGLAIFALPASLHAFDAVFLLVIADHAVALSRIGVDIVSQIKRQQLISGVVTQHGNQRRIHVEEAILHAGAVDPVHRALHLGAIARFRLAQRIFIALAQDGGGHALGNEGEDFQLTLSEALFFDVALQSEHAEGSVAGFQRYAQPIQAGSADQFHLALRDELLFFFRSGEQRLAGAQHILGKSFAQFFRGRRRVLLIHEIRKR